MKFDSYNHKELEPGIIKFWQENKIVDKLRNKNKNGKKFNFLDGPPYTSGKFHLAHAWNYALKDLSLRYKRMHGFNVWDRNGFDVHGLPTEHKVMDKYNLKTKEDIEKFGVDKFVKECQKFCLEMADVMTKDLVRMGVTFDLSDPYMALKTEFMEGEWDLIKKAYQKKKLYYGEKVLTWCQHCETAVAKHECEYKNVNEPSIFVKFPIKGKKDEYLIIWTTTPWTIPFNLAIMVNPKLDYVKVDVEGEKWILAKALVGVVVQAVVGKKMKVLKEFKGKKLEGTAYNHPFDKFIPKYAELKKDYPNVHTVILSEEYVDTSAGTGLVHSAPGCGPEDHEACKPYKIPPFNNLAEDGFFPKNMGVFSGLRAKVDDKKFIQVMKDEEVLLAQTNVEHEYPHCWRCKNPIIFRITFQWFFKVEEIKEKILKGNKKVHWVPDTSLHAYESWVKNLRDNSISRQRYWGTPLPIWKCKKCEEVKIVNSRKEIEKEGGIPPENLHIPWIDKVKLDCKCGSKMDRVSDVIDVWVDAGTASWNCLNNDPKKMKEWYPADLILEAKEQTRLWFSMLSICSYLYLDKNAFKNVYVYGMLNDIEGKKMSKSIGNIISPYELIDKHGVDVLRFYMCQNNAGQDINFSWDECKVKHRQLNILWNVQKLLINLSKENNLNPFKIEEKEVKSNFKEEEKYILSKLNSTIEKTTNLFEKYQIDEAILPLQELFLELSRTYIQMIRDKSSLGSEKEKKVCVYVIGKVFFDLLKMMSIVTPFISEAIYLNLQEEFKLSEKSISHFSWPKGDKKKIDTKLEKEVEIARQIITASSAAREKSSLGLRWPIKEIIIAKADKEISSAVKKLSGIIKNQVNCKDIKFVDNLKGISHKIRPDYAKIGPVYGNILPQIIAKINKEDPKKIMKSLEKGSYDFKVEKKEVNITKEMLFIEEEVPKPYFMSSWKGLSIYVNAERTKELEAEGYSREVMRHLQSSRKKAGLQKTDFIFLTLTASEEMKDKLLMFEKEIKDKVGAQEMTIVSTKTPKQQFQEEFKVKKESFIATFSKV